MKSIILLLSSLPLMAQFSSTAYHIAPGASLPATCNPANGDVWFKTSATIAVYYCSTTNTWTLISAGSGGSPSAPSGSLQFNDSGAFGGTADLIWDAPNDRIKIVPSTSSNAGIQTVNTTANRYIGYYLNGTGYGFLEQMNHGVGTADYLSLEDTTAVVSGTNPNGLVLAAGNGPVHIASGVGDTFAITTEMLRVNATGVIGLGPFPSLTTMDLGIYRKAAGLAQVNTGTVDTLADLELSTLFISKNVAPTGVTNQSAAWFDPTDGATVVNFSGKSANGTPVISKLPQTNGNAGTFLDGTGVYASPFPATAPGALVNDTNLAGETLTNPDLASGTNWSVSGDFALAANAATFTKSTGIGTLTQAAGDLAIVRFTGRWYRLLYTVSAITGSPSCLVTGFSGDTPLTITAGAQMTFVQAGSDTPGNFDLVCTAAAAATVTFDDFSLQEMTAGSLSIGNTVQPLTYLSHDGTPGVSGATCSAWKDGLCVAN